MYEKPFCDFFNADEHTDAGLSFRAVAACALVWSEPDAQADRNIPSERCGPALHAGFLPVVFTAGCAGIFCDSLSLAALH